MPLFYLVSAAFFGFLGIIWERNTMLNTFLKVFSLGMSVWALWLWTLASGYVVKG